MIPAENVSPSARRVSKAADRPRSPKLSPWVKGAAARAGGWDLFRLLFVVWLAGSEVQAAGFVQDRFAIGYWVGPQTQDQLEERYREIAEANFTLVIGSHGMDVRRQLELCAKFGLKAIVEASGPAKEFPDGDACWGYSIVDEPGAGAFAEHGRRAAEIRAARPGRFGYINLFPNYASAAQLGTPTYEEHVERFMKEVRPEVLSMDHYPAMRPDLDTRDAYCENLETFRRHAAAAGVPFWNFFYSMPFGNRIDPTEAQIRWQINTSLAYGARGVLYFCYWTPGKGNKGTGEFPKGGAIITAEGIKTRHYDEARRINAELKNLGPTLMKLTSLGVVRHRTAAPNPALASTPVRSISAIRGDPPAEFLVGHLRHEDGRRAVILVNHSYSYTAWPTVEFDVPAGAVLEVSKTDGTVAPALDSSPELDGLQLSLGAGDARLLILPERP